MDTIARPPAPALRMGPVDEECPARRGARRHYLARLLSILPVGPDSNHARMAALTGSSSWLVCEYRTPRDLLLIQARSTNRSRTRLRGGSTHAWCANLLAMARTGVWPALTRSSAYNESQRGAVSRTCAPRQQYLMKTSSCVGRRVCFFFFEDLWLQRNKYNCQTLGENNRSRRVLAADVILPRDKPLKKSGRPG